LIAVNRGHRFANLWGGAAAGGPTSGIRGSALASAGFVTGLAAEARLARRLGPALAGGGSAIGAEAAGERLARAGASALVSFGLCGGLDRTLGPGSLVVPESVLAAGERFATDRVLADALGGCTAALLAAEPAILASATAKRALFERTGAVAVDLESGAIARVAARHGLPFAVLRAVCDPAEMTLPPLALTALDEGGRIRGARLAWALLRTPGDLPALIALAGAAGAARAALRRRVARILDMAGPPADAARGVR
jgi:adenosylhomocysteine nucleosidase